MAMDDDGRQEFDARGRDERTPLGVEVIRDLAMREALGLLDEDESALFEEAFVVMTPDDQAAVLDLQAAVAREIAGGGNDEPDRALRYKVLARLTEEMASDRSASGPIAVIGSAGSIGGAGTRSAGRPTSAARGATEGGGVPPIDGVSAPRELQFRRVRRSAAVWRAASFALGAAAIAFGVLHYQGQSVSQQLLGERASDIVADRLGDLFGDEIDLARYLDSSTAVVEALAAVPGSNAGAGFFIRESKPRTNGDRPAVLLGFQFPVEVTDVTVVAVRIDGSGTAKDFGRFQLNGRTAFAALPLRLEGIDLATVFFEVRDAATGEALMRTAVPTVVTA